LLIAPFGCHFVLFTYFFSQILDNEGMTCYNDIAGKIIAQLVILVKWVLPVRIGRSGREGWA
jgi:hypothetical protein